MVDMTTKVRAISVAHDNECSPRQAMNLPLEDTEQWILVPFFIYHFIARGEFSTVRMIKMIICLGAYRILMMVAGLVCTWWFDNALLISIGASTFIYQLASTVKMGSFLQRVGQPRVDKVLKKDSRSPILFLRPFKLDDLVVSPFASGWRIFKSVFSMHHPTFEEFLAIAFEEIGPVIALGRPGESVAPIGAAREYVDNTSWRRRVFERADRSRLVIIEWDATPSMEWEIQNISQWIGLRRIVFVLPLGEKGEMKRSPDWYNKWANLREKFTFLPEVSDDTVAVLFNEYNLPIVVSSNSWSLQKRIAVIKDAWLKNVQSK